MVISLSTSPISRCILIGAGLKTKQEVWRLRNPRANFTIFPLLSQPLSDPIALGAEVLLRHNVRWRWEKDMTHQAKPRTGKVIRIRRLKPAVDAAGVREGGDGGWGPPNPAPILRTCDPPTVRTS